MGIPKPGGGVRELGIPTVVDRLIQQALLQVLQPLIDPTFSEHSHGFRPGRSAHGAVLEAQQHVQAGYRVVVDVDLEKFFDRVNHDILMDRLAKRIADKRVLRLIRRYLQAGILAHGVQHRAHEGTPQGGPLSPLLANVLLDEVDRELERAGTGSCATPTTATSTSGAARRASGCCEALRGCYARLRAEGQRVQDGGGRGLGAQVPGLLLLGGAGGRSPAGGGCTGACTAARAHPAADTAHAGAQPRTDRGRTCGTTCPAGRRTSGWRRRPRSCASWTNGCGTGCAPCSSSSGAAGRRSSASCERWVPSDGLGARASRATPVAGGATAA